MTATATLTAAPDRLHYLPGGIIIAATRDAPSPARRSKSGYGSKLPTSTMVTLEDGKARRVYVRIYGNVGTPYVLVKGEEWILSPDAESEIEILDGLGFPFVDPWKLDDFTRRYLETALWSSTDDSDDSGGNPLDDGRDFTDFAPSALARAAVDCARFQRENEKTLEYCYNSDVYIQGEKYNSSNAGHDFWLTRCGHGVGFWDRGLGGAGERLSDVCRKWGNIDPYLGDNGKVYLM